MNSGLESRRDSISDSVKSPEGTAYLAQGVSSGAGVWQEFMDSEPFSLGTPSVSTPKGPGFSICSASAPCHANALAAPCISCIAFDGVAVFGVRRPCAALDFCGAEVPTPSRTTVCAAFVRKTKRQRTAALQRSLPSALREACRDQIAHWAPLICAKLQARGVSHGAGKIKALKGRQNFSDELDEYSILSMGWRLNRCTTTCKVFPA
jgi:hypothetical protein